MGKDKNMTWFHDRFNLNTSPAAPVVRQAIVGIAEGSLEQGKSWLNRVIGRCGARWVGIVAGAENGLDAWWGLCIASDESASSECSILDGTDDNIAWLWRAPIISFPMGRAPGGTEWHFDFEFDIQIRGGKGSNIRPGTNMYWVLNTPEAAFFSNYSAFQTRWSLQTLYSGE